MLNIPRREKDYLKIGGVLNFQLEVSTSALDDPIFVLNGLTGNPDGRTQEDLIYTEQGDKTLIKGYLRNRFLDQGLAAILENSLFGLTPTLITHICLSGDNSAVTGATTSIDPSASGFSSKVLANVYRTGTTAGGDQTWSNTAETTEVPFSIRKLALATGDAATDVVNIIGGEGISEFEFNFNTLKFTLTIGIDITLSAA